MNFTVELGLATASDEHSSAFLGETLSGAKAVGRRRSSLFNFAVSRFGCGKSSVIKQTLEMQNLGSEEMDRRSVFLCPAGFFRAGTAAVNVLAVTLARPRKISPHHLTAFDAHGQPRDRRFAIPINLIERNGD